MKRPRIEKGSAWALVTGAGSGIGRRYAEHLAREGYNLVIVGSDPDRLARAKEEIAGSYGTEIRIVEMDLARLTASQELFDRVQSEGIRIDVLVNNAGIFSFLDIVDTPPERIERIILLHDLTTTMNCRLFADDMIRRGIRGHILNMSSYSLWMPFPGLSLYSASKAYIKSFSVAFSKEVQEKGLKVTAVCPAGVATDLFGLSPRWQRIARRLGALITADTCARRGLRAMWRGRRCIVPDWWNRLWIPICQALPMCVLRPVRRFTTRFQK